MIIHKYLFQELIKYFFIVLVTVIGIFVAIDYLGTMDEFLSADVSLFRAFLYVLLKIPFMIIRFIPVGLLISVLIVFSLMNRNNEIVALKSCGININFILRPVLISGFLFTCLLLFISEIITPFAMTHVNKIKKNEIRKEINIISTRKDIWIKGVKTITHIKYYNPIRAEMFGIVKYFFDDSFNLAKRIDAEKGMHMNGKWTLLKVLEQNRDNSGTYKTFFHEVKNEKLNFLPEDLNEAVKKSDEMNVIELRNYIKKVEAEGYDATIYKVDFFARTAFPFVCIIMCIIGTGLTAGGKLTRSLPISISYGVGIAFFFWVFFNFCCSLGYGEMLPPFVAAWTANCVFLCYGMFLILNAE